MDKNDPQGDKQQTDGEKAPESQNKTSYFVSIKERLKNIRPHEWFMILFTGVIAFSTTVYTFYARSQWQVMSSQQRLIQESNEHAYRAWLTAKNVKVKGFKTLVVPESDVSLSVVIENTGRSPAQNIQTASWTLVTPKKWVIPDEPSPVAKIGVIDLYVLGPGQTSEVPFRLKKRLSAKQAKAINVGRLILYYIANITFSDQFSDSRALRFCHRYEPAEGKNPAHIRPCTTHNDVR